MPISGEELYEPIKEFLKNSASLTKAALDEDEDAMANFRALGKLKEEERIIILGSDVPKYNHLLKCYIINKYDLLGESPSLLAYFRKVP